MTGVLAVQGDFAEHERMLSAVGEDFFEIRQLSDLDHPIDRLILPGGESTVQTKLMDELGLSEKIRSLILNGLPTLATCAGLILLAEDITNDSRHCLATLPVSVLRNAYGRQLGSFRTDGEFKGIGTVPMEFIRAPYIESVRDGVDILSVTDGNITAVRYKNQLAMSFHPELLDDTRIFEYFLSM